MKIETTLLLQLNRAEGEAILQTETAVTRLQLKDTRLIHPMSKSQHPRPLKRVRSNDNAFFTWYSAERVSSILRENEGHWSNNVNMSSIPMNQNRSIIDDESNLSGYQFLT